LVTPETGLTSVDCGDEMKGKKLKTGKEKRTPNAKPRALMHFGDIFEQDKHVQQYF
jgi:hypothetical protein